MSLRANLFRLAALLVLLAAGLDYVTFDSFDPGAPMDSVIVSGGLGCSVVRTAELADDHCLFCSPSIVTSKPPLNALVRVDSHRLTCAARLLARVRPAVERPPRV